MSVSDEEISTVGGSGGGDGDGGGGGVSGNGGDDGDDDEDESGGVRERGDQKPKQRAKGYTCNGFSRNFGKAKHLVLRPFTNTRAQKQVSKKTHIKASSSYCSGAGAAPKYSTTSSGKGCCFCFTKSPTGESSMRSQSSPNDPTFTYDMLKVLIERNGFYSKECNPHLDSQVSCCRD
ncbi:hypothetical protein PanWU01x14_086740 [Parasponia andersonii]|uniref:Uncharacterized protein n=1 Tax=Parasponia andersonii TaxID=3476 RepID=A0A2P5D8C6_PARAD|nr:hypothetical protein PanWU01x14_086740 [Parasponia andersonii]